MESRLPFIPMPADNLIVVNAVCYRELELWGSQ
jgi:hypothetical protein